MTPYVIVGNGGNGQMTISDGATVSVLGNGQRNFTVSNTATGSGVLTMTNGATSSRRDSRSATTAEPAAPRSTTRP